MLLLPDKAGLERTCGSLQGLNNRQTVKKEDNHDHNNLVSYQCIIYFTKFTKIFRDSNYNTSGLSTGLAIKLTMIIIISMNKSQELKVFHGRQKLTSAKN